MKKTEQRALEEACLSVALLTENLGNRGGLSVRWIAMCVLAQVEPDHTMRAHAEHAEGSDKGYLARWDCADRAWHRMETVLAEARAARMKRGLM